MAKPDLEDGYLCIAHELFAALACAGFNKWEWVVIREVLDQIYGRQKRKVAALSPTDIASRAGTYKESIVRAIRSLKDGGVLKETGNGVQFIKNYEAWKWSGNPRLTATEQAYCHAAKPPNVSTKRGNESAPVTSTKAGNESDPISTIIGNESAPNGERICSPTGTKALPVGNGFVPRAHYIERGSRELIEKFEKSEKGVLARGLNSSHTGREGEEHELFVKVVAELEAYKPTAFLASALIEAAETPCMRNVPSWRMFVACRTVQRPDKSKTWGFFQSVALNCSYAEYQRLSKALPPADEKAAPKIFGIVREGAG